MDAEIRRLTYSSKPPNSQLPPGLAALFGEHPERSRKNGMANALSSSATTSPTTHPVLEARIAELEADRAAIELRHAELLRNAQATAAAALDHALNEQKATLDREWAARTEACLAAFEQARADYFAQAEAAVVRLALAIARRIMHREAQVDPVLLRGVVRVALEDAQGGTTCVVEVAAQRQALWQEWLNNEGRGRAEVRGVDDVPEHYCRVSLGLSHADLSTDAQLAEIERGFFDMLRKPAGSRAPEAL